MFLLFLSPYWALPMEGTVYLTHWKATFRHPLTLASLCGEINVLEIIGIVVG